MKEETKNKTSTFDHYIRVCRTEAPYPLNYLPSGDDSQKVLGATIGMLIEKGMLR